MSVAVPVPTLSVNETQVTVVEWRKGLGDKVSKGEPIALIETTKATAEVEAPADGYLHPLVMAGEQVAVGAMLAAILEHPGEPLPTQAPQGEAPEGGSGWTKKAAIVARRLGVDIEQLASRMPGRTITEADVLAAQSDDGGGRDLMDDGFPAVRSQRLLLLGGGAGAGQLVLDTLSRLRHQRAVGILDGNPATHGKTVRGVPVLGPVSEAEALWRQGVCDAVIILFTENVAERRAVFEDLSSRGVPFANIIDPSVHVGLNVSMGQGNLIMANNYFATGVTLGDNNFFASQGCVEHHSKVGSHCAFGPRLTTSGRVTIGDRVKMGMQVAIEPYVTIGDDCLVASGSVITAPIPAGSLVRTHVTQTVKPREDL